MKRPAVLLSLLIAGLAWLAPPWVPATEPASSPPRSEERRYADDQGRQSLLVALDHQIAYLERCGQRVHAVGGTRFTTADLLSTARLFREGVAEHFGADSFDRFVERRFRTVRIGPPAGDGLVTGYFCPALRASPERTDAFRHPLFRPPPECSAREPSCPTRREIDEGALDGRGLEIAWVDDYLDLYWLQVQGSGFLTYPDGGRRTAHYAGNNDRSYRSIGSELMSDGRLAASRATLQGIDRFLRDHPALAREYLWRNPRYIFFSIDDQPVRGAGEIPLTPMRSVAADPAFLPLGAVCHLRYESPAPASDGSTRNNSAPRGHFVMVQDRGAAIRGRGRIDLFIGFGHAAREVAGRLGSPGETVLFLIRQPAD